MTDLFWATICFLLASGLYVRVQYRPNAEFLQPSGFEQWLVRIAVILGIVGAVLGLRWLALSQAEITSIRQNRIINPELERTRLQLQLAQELQRMSAERFDFFKHQVEGIEVETIIGDSPARFVVLPGFGRIPEYIVQDWADLSAQTDRLRRGFAVPVGEWSDSKDREFVIQLRSFLRKRGILSEASGPYPDRFNQGWTVYSTAKLFGIQPNRTPYRTPYLAQGA